ncbi:MAG: exo-beta-N-acetylmuramidase NamZ domain-containing protein [Bacteroidales bacterium]
MKNFLCAILLATFGAVSCTGTTPGNTERLEEEKTIMPGAWQTEAYFPLLEGKRIGLVGNHTSLIGEVHLADSLLAAGFDLIRVFSPEHGFRGVAAAGEYVQSGTDLQTGLPVISLYGTNRRPSPKDLEDLDILIFDMQDVGVRFYTYISTMSYVMEEAARLAIPMLILDRPNPNGHFVDGPVLQPRHTSFVGLHPIPVVHGMTIAEYAQMVNGQGWLGEGLQCQLHIVPVKNYERTMWYELPVAPSPNLPNMTSIMLYPGVCYFEGTTVSLGRGTDFPFQVYGHPDLPARQFPFSFTPESRSAAPNPPQLGKLCNGRDLRTDHPRELMQIARLDLSHLLTAWKYFPDKSAFFNNFFERLSGTDELRAQIKAGKSEEEIRQSWQSGLEEFKDMRKPYLIYPDID